MRITYNRLPILLVLLFCLWSSNTLAAQSVSAVESPKCEIADVLFGDIALHIIPYEGYETAIIRHNNFQNSEINYGALKGELSVERAGFSVRNTNQVVVGIITPELIVEGWDDGCDHSAQVTIQPVKNDVYVILNGSEPVGTIEGRFPK